MDKPLSLPSQGRTRWWPALLVWAGAAALMHALDRYGDLASLAMVLILACTLTSLWLPLWGALLSGGLALLAFNWFFVPPRGTLAVDLRQHVLLLVVMLLTSGMVAVLLHRLRRQAREARAHAHRAEQLRLWGDALRHSAQPHEQGGELQQLLAQACASTVDRLPTVHLLVLPDEPPALNDDAAARWIGQPDEDQRTGLWLCLRESRAMGPGTGWYDDLPAWYLPLRGQGQGESHGAALLSWTRGPLPEASVRLHAQALCDQMGQALYQAQTTRSRQHAIEATQLQAVRNALLAAISHDYRTPLATIVGAASSLIEQAERLSPAQQRQLAQTVVEQAEQLSRLTSNTLQLARLDAPGVALQLDWESAEELVGAVLRRSRQHDPARRLRGRLEPGLPLLRCDAILMTQMLDNLVENALKYSPADAPVEILVRQQQGQLVLAVRDRGPGVAPSWRERIFEAFQRGQLQAGDPATAEAEAAQRPRGAGVGLAVCRAIARAHGGELRLRARSHGGSSFECWLPIQPQPGAAPESA